jgi:trehalose/maltose hydrolase-like predicted phosphorylase
LQDADVPFLIGGAYVVEVPDLRPEELARLQVIKQPDVLMLIYLLAEDFTPAEKRANWEFYEPKTVHDSSLSPAIHAILGAEVGADSKAYAYFRQAAGLDLEDALGNTASGLHAAALGGLWQAVVHGFGVVRLGEGGLTVRPALPRRWRALRFLFVYRGARLACCFTRAEVHLTLVGPAPDHSVRLRLLDRDVTLDARTPEVSLRFTP